MNISLREITADTVRDVTRLTVAPDQQRFVAPNAVSLAQALFSKEAWYRAAYGDDELVGFVMLYDETLREAPPAEPRLVMWRLMVDRRFQGRGIGRAIVHEVIAHARRKSFKVLSTSFVRAPGGPEDFYLSLGFVPTGELDEDEIVVALPLDPPAPGNGGQG